MPKNVKIHVSSLINPQEFNVRVFMQKNIRNIAVIAHVDHGKTTLVDALLKQTHTFRDNEEEMQVDRIMDSNDLERERGITITAKNCAVTYKGVKINIVDTPGHADFSGEVERTLSMADGALLIIDAQEGPMPGSRFVLRKALELGIKPIVLINKIDKPYARIPHVLQKTEDLFLELVNHESQLEYPILYSISRAGKVFNALPLDLNAEGNVIPLLDKIIDYVPSPENRDDKPFKMLVSSLDYNSHLGRILIGKVHQGTLKLADKLVISGKAKTYKAEKLFVYQGLSKIEVGQACSGDIVSIAGVFDAIIGDTIANPADSGTLPSISISEPTMHISIGPNTSPFVGQEGELTTSRQIGERLVKELETNLSLKLHNKADGRFQVSGRGELHLAILLESMRREGYELEVGKPKVVLKELNGQTLEPVEEVNIIVPKEHAGVINQELGKRHAHLQKMEPVNDKEVEFIYKATTQSLLGLRSLLMTASKGTILFSSELIAHEPLTRPIPSERNGVLIAAEGGEALSYGLHAAQGRGITFIAPGTKVYEGMIIGKNAKQEDIAINVCKGKKLTNMRSKSSDGIIQLAPPTQLSLEQMLDFLGEDELLEITPKSLRLRKKHLTELERRRHRKSQ